MTFAWPWLLLTLLAVPPLVWAYLGLLRRRGVRLAELASLGLVGPASSRRSRRLVPPVLFLLALTVLLAGLARPRATVADPRLEGTVILAFDVSGSMAATDMTPTRMEAAKAAAKAFVQQQPSDVRIGVVGFGESAVVAARPSTDRAAVLAAVARLTPQGGTSLGSGLQSALSAIAGRTVTLPPADEQAGSTGDIGYHGSAAVVLLSDGEDTGGPDPLEVAELASTAGVKVYPVGLGSPDGTVLEIDGFSVATALDETLLQDIADTTDGRYLPATDAAALTEVYRSIDLSWTLVSRPIEVTALFAGVAALLLLLGVGLSLAGSGRVVWV